MGLITLFLKGKILQKILGGMSRSPQPGRGGGLFGKKAAMAAIAAMILKRAFRRR